MCVVVCVVCALNGRFMCGCMCVFMCVLNGRFTCVCMCVCHVCVEWEVYMCVYVRVFCVC